MNILEVINKSETLNDICRKIFKKANYTNREKVKKILAENGIDWQVWLSENKVKKTKYCVVCGKTRRMRLMKRIQKIPKEEDITNVYSPKGWDSFATHIFTGWYILQEPPKYGDGITIKFFDDKVRAKIRREGRYKCWYHRYGASDPADTSVQYYIVYVEEIPEEMYAIEEGMKTYEEYIKNHKPTRK